MGSRERKREERRKRKRRTAERAPEAVSEPDNGASAATSAPERFEERIARRSEERNAKARAELKPLAEGERPAAVTAGAVVSALLAIVFTVSAVLAAAGVEVGGRDPEPLPIAFFAAVLWLMAWGMFRARYWAVLGFQMVLVLTMLASALGLVQVATILQALATTALLLGSGALFYFLIRAMARIQMPEPPGR
jgi:cation transport ATPase